MSISHNLENIRAEKFVGIRLGNGFVNFEFSDEDEPAHNFYKMIIEKYDIVENLDIKFNSSIMASKKVVAFVPEMCYCCT